MSTADLLPVKNAVLVVATATVKLHDEIRTARHEGASLREIAIAASMSHEQVRRIAR